jgi:hypothetical protein
MTIRTRIAEVFWKRRHRVYPAGLAQSLFDEFVEKAIASPEALHLNAANAARYETKAKLYRIAIILLALVSEEQKNPKFSSVRNNFESKVFPPSIEQEGVQLLTEVKTAMRDFSDLLTERRELSWARAWLQDIGLDEANPAALAMLGLHWMDYYIMVVKTLRELRPSA